jgi:phage-related holin
MKKKQNVVNDLISRHLDTSMSFAGQSKEQVQLVITSVSEFIYHIVIIEHSRPLKFSQD